MKHYRNISMVALVSIIIILSGCGSKTEISDVEDGSSNDVYTSENLFLIDEIDIWNVNALDGTGDIIALQYTDVSNAGATSGFEATLNLYQQDPIDKDNLISLSSVYLGVNTLYQRTSNINVNKDWITVVLNHNDYSKGWVAVVSLLNYQTYSLDVLLPIEETLDRAAANGNWLLVSYNNTLDLYDISDTNLPLLVQSFPFNISISNIASFTDGYYIFTQNGYSYLDLSDINNITLTDITNIDLKAVEKSYLAGNKLYISGPSKNTGMTMAAKLDITDPVNPNVEIIKHDIDGSYIDFAFDPKSSYYYIVTFNTLYKFEENSTSLNLLNAEAITTPYMKPKNKLFYAVGERLYDAQPGINIWKY